MRYSIKPLADEVTARLVAGWIFEEWKDEELWPSFERTLAEVRNGINSCGLPHYLVAFDAQGQPVGTVSLIKDDLPTRLDLNPWLASLYVLPAHRGNGLARQLIGEILKISDQLAIPQLYAFTRKLMDLNREFGFAEIGQEDFNGKPVRVMVRKG